MTDSRGMPHSDSPEPCHSGTPGDTCAFPMSQIEPQASHTRTVTSGGNQRQKTTQLCILEQTASLGSYERAKSHLDLSFATCKVGVDFRLAQTYLVQSSSPRHQRCLRNRQFSSLTAISKFECASTLPAGQFPKLRTTDLHRGSVNYSPLAKSGPQPAFYGLMS